MRCHTEAAFDVGAPRLAEFEEAVQQSARTLLVLSPAYLADGFSRFGDLLAQTYGMETATWPVIPLVLCPVDLPPRLAFLTALDATNPEDWPNVTVRLCAALKRPVPGPEAAERPACPYPGMVAFAEEDSERFFGRDEEIRGAVGCLRAHPFLTIIGPSGSGKLSLVFAGLVPALRRSALFGHGEWLVRSFRPGATPMATLEAALGGSVEDVPRTVARVLAEESEARRLLLIVDQFEELFTVGGGDRPRFEAALRALADAPDCFLLLTARADFYPELMGSTLWRYVEAQRLEVLPLGETGLRQAILRPAEEIGVYVEAALVERLVADAAGEPGVLPLVQETLVLLWERLERHFLPLSAYEALVLPRRAYGPTSAAGRTGLQVAMARRADGALAELSEAQQRIARRILLRLVQIGEGRADTRRQQPVAALREATDDAALFDAMLGQLADHRLLTLGGDEGGGRTVDVAHEALIRGWPRFERWLTERREAEQTRRRLEAKAAEWVRLGRGAAGLLDEVELAEAERWLEGPDAADLGPGEALPALVHASREATEEAHRREEAARERELEQARALATAEAQRAREQARAAARQRVWFMVAGLLAAVAVAALMVALFGRAEAEAERARGDLTERVAMTVALANEARLQLSLHQDEQAALSALEAYRLNGGTTGAARGAVDEALRAVLAEPNFANILEAGAAVDAVAFSGDGQTLVTGRRDGVVRRWTMAESGATVAEWPAHDWVKSVAFSPAGDRLASGGRDGAVRLWDMNAPAGTTGQTFWVGFQVASVAFSPDGLQLAAGGNNGAVLVWDLANVEEPPTSLISGASAIESLAFDPATRALAAAGFGTSSLQLWDLDLPTAPPTDLTVPTVTFESVAFSADGHLAAGGSDGVVRYWRNGAWTEPDVLMNPEDSASVVAVTFTPDGTRLAAAHGTSGNTWLWDLRERKVGARLHGHDGIVTSLAFGAEGRTLATGGGDKTVRVWEIAEPPTPAVLRGHGGATSAVAYGRDSLLLASGTLTDGSCYGTRMIRMRPRLLWRATRRQSPRWWPTPRERPLPPAARMAPSCCGRSPSGARRRVSWLERERSHRWPIAQMAAGWLREVETGSLARYRCGTPMDPANRRSCGATEARSSRSRSARTAPSWRPAAACEPAEGPAAATEAASSCGTRPT